MLRVMRIYRDVLRITWDGVALLIIGWLIQSMSEEGQHLLMHNLRDVVVGSSGGGNEQ